MYVAVRTGYIVPCSFLVSIAMLAPLERVSLVTPQGRCFVSLSLRSPLSASPMHHLPLGLYVPADWYDRYTYTLITMHVYTFVYVEAQWRGSTHPIVTHGFRPLWNAIITKELIASLLSSSWPTSQSMGGNLLVRITRKSLDCIKFNSIEFIKFIQHYEILFFRMPLDREVSSISLWLGGRTDHWIQCRLKLLQK